MRQEILIWKRGKNSARPHSTWILFENFVSFVDERTTRRAIELNVTRNGVFALCKYEYILQKYAFQMEHKNIY